MSPIDQFPVASDTDPPSLVSQKNDDVTGRDRFASNLLYSWGGYIIVIVAGFLTPRLIDRHLGQMQLGVWDFSWSFVSYLNLAMLGIGSSINRYVAKYRAAGDSARLDRMVSTVVCLQVAIAILVLLVAGVLGWYTPLLFGHRLGGQTVTAQWTIILLGATLSVNMAFDTARGVLTGCHRWDLHNRISAVSQFLELAGMLTVLSLGGGLRFLCLTILCVASGTGYWRLWYARRVCPELSIQLRLFRWKVAKEMARFGLKTLIFEAPMLLLVQTTNLFLVQSLGPASLAVFSRSMALVRHTESFMSKFAFILAPTAGSLQGMEKEEELRKFFLATTRYGVVFASPLLFFLIIDGDLVLRLWMGDRYVHGPVLTILSLGFFLPIAQNSVREILKGLNAHGKVGLLSFCISSCCFIIGSTLLQTIGWTLNGAAIVLAASLTIGLGFAPAIYACRKLRVPYLHYLKNTLLAPLLCNSVFVGCLFVGRQIFPTNTLLAIGAGGSAGILLLVGVYLCFIYPEKGRVLWVNLQQKIGLIP